MTLFSRILGFIRDSVVARIFGSGIDTDAFFVAFKLPNLLRRIFAEGAFSQAFVPILSEYKNKKGDKETRIFISNISGLLIFTLILITFIGILLAPWIIMFTAPGFYKSSEGFVLSSTLLRITFPYILLISLASLAGTILNVWNYFLASAFGPALLNISIISFALFGTPFFHPPILALAWSVIIGGMLQLIYQLQCLKKIGMLEIPRLNLKESGIFRVLHKMVPAVFAVSVSQISLIMNTIFASFLVSGSVSWLYYADRLMEFPCGILGVALSTILLPSLSKSFTNKNYDEHSRLIDCGLRLCFLLALPSAAALGILSGPIIVTLFQYGKFTAFDTVMTQRSLVTYSIGLIGFIVVKVLATGFYSCQNINTPVRVAVITLFVTQILNLIFLDLLKHAGLSLSISLAACLNGSLLFWKLRKKKIFQPQPGWFDFFLRLILAVIVMSVVLVTMLTLMPAWDIGNISYRLFRLIIVCTAGISVYFIVLKLLGLRLQDFSNIQLH